MRYFLATLAGIVFGGVIVAIVQAIGHEFYPPPEGMDFKDVNAVGNWIRDLPVGAFLFVAASWAVGTFCGSVLATYIAKGATSVPGYIVGLFVLGANFFNIYMYPHPVWMVVLAVAAPLVMSWVGVVLLRKSG